MLSALIISPPTFLASLTAKFDLLNKGINIDNINYIEGKSKYFY